MHVAVAVSFAAPETASSRVTESGAVAARIAKTSSTPSPLWSATIVRPIKEFCSSFCHVDQDSVRFATWTDTAPVSAVAT